MIVIGESINGTRGSVADAIVNRNEEFLGALAKAQADAGADYIDVNSGIGKDSETYEIEAMEWLVEVVQEATDKPLVIDSDRPAIIEAALRRYRGERLIINSVDAEPERLNYIGSLAAERNAWLVALAMGASGIPDKVEGRLEACDQIMEQLIRLGLSEEQILFDPLVLPIAVDSTQGIVTLKTLEQIKHRYPRAKTILGLSNISYGLPGRGLINTAFMQMAAYAGVDAVISDVLDPRVMGFIKVANVLTGKDKRCKDYIRTHRKGLLRE